ncbi:hypothetical protein [Luteibacter sp. ME-Dv--P-043b]|uniref:hypothetical protein n=1 Tax=Luteibacter sp. ME-Dv--P-043b TaxID=3040291 RepID=UPI002552BD22|nr:hypothetical protein [Luteibacter sp. ME-Dv--P-043b]
MQVAVPGLFLLLTACGGNMEDPRIELNPHPTMRYTITASIADAPGAFDTIEADAQYQVTNNDCAPEQPISGARIVPRKRVRIELQQAGDGAYQGEVYVDRMKDQDYYAHGICRWSLVAVSIRARHGKMEFDTPLFVPRFFEKGGITRYFSYDAYNESGTRLAITGNENRNAYAAPSKTFSVTLLAREAIQ